MSDSLNPRTTSYEFFGPPGAFAISIGVPILNYALYFGCSEQTGGCPPKLDLDLIVKSLSTLDWWKSLWDTEASLIYLAWYTFCVAAWAILPGDEVEGTTLRNGGKKKYKINGANMSPCLFYLRVSNTLQRVAFSTFLLALGVTSGVILRFGPEAFTLLYDKWVGFLTASLIMSFVQATYVHIASFGNGKLLAKGGNSGNTIYDVSSSSLHERPFH